MPGNEAKLGHLTGEFHRIVQAARDLGHLRHLQLRATSQMWTVLKHAAEEHRCQS